MASVCKILDSAISAKNLHLKCLCVNDLTMTLDAETYREVCGSGLGGDNGYFLYEINPKDPAAGIEVIAKATSQDAAVRLFEIIAAAA